MPSRRLRTSLALLATTSLLLVASACGTDQSGGEETAPSEAASAPASPAAPTSAPAESPTPTEAAPTEAARTGAAPTHSDPAARAAQGALAAVPGDVISIDPERGSVWSVLVRDANGRGTEVYVDATDGTVNRQEREALPAVARTGAPAITAVEAIDVALKAQPSGAVRELDLGLERTRVVWEIKVRGGGNTEFYIDATSGQIVKQERA